MANTYDSTINSFYLAYYGRPADPAGLAFWTMQLANVNGDLGAIADAFANSEEATVRFGDSDATARITQIYEQLFNRQPDSEGLAFWSNAIEQGHMSMADAAIEILRGAQREDADLSALRQEAAERFTAAVAASGVDYDGYAAVEAARVLVKAVGTQATPADIDAMVAATARLVDIAHDNPQVVEAIATGTTLVALFDTARGQAEPVNLVQALADVAQAAAGSPATLESLLRGGGMAKVLDVMPSRATLHDVVDALASGGLPAAVEVVYPTTPQPQPPQPEPGPQPDPAPVAGTLSFIDLEGGSGNELPYTNNAMLMVELQGQDADATVTYQISRNGTDWGTAAEIGSQTDGTYYYRAMVTDAAGRSAYSNVIGAVLDRAAPLWGMLRPGETDSLLALGETLDFEVGFNEAVVVNPDAPPTLALQNGGTAIYKSGSGSSTLVFSYTPAAGDENGVFGTAVAAALQGAITDRAGNALRAQSLDGLVPDDSLLIDAEAPQQVLTVTGIAQREGVSPPATGAGMPLATGLAQTTLRATLSQALADDEYVEYSLDKGATWEPVFPGEDGLSIAITDIATAGNPTVALRVSDAAGNHGAEVRQAIAYDGDAPVLGTVALVSLTHGARDSAPNDTVTNVAEVEAQFSFSGTLAPHETLQYKVDGQEWKAVAADAGGRTVTIRDLDLVNGLPNADGKLELKVSLRAVDGVGNEGAAAETTLTYDTQIAALSFGAVEGAVDGQAPHATALAQADVGFRFTGTLEDTDKVEYRIGTGAWAAVDPASIDRAARTITVHDVPLADADPTVELRITDAAGNQSSASQKIDGPYQAGLSTQATPDGVLVSSPAGSFSLAEPVFRDPTTPVVATPDSLADGDDTTALLGAQSGYSRQGIVEVAVDGGGTLTDTSGKVYTLGTNGTDTLTGQNLWGFDGDDTVTGTALDDYLSGGNGADTIRGAGGKDSILGGAGTDTMTGGAGADTFVFASRADGVAGSYPGEFDVITDFDAPGGDRLDFSATDTAGVRADRGITIDTTYHTVLADLIGDAAQSADGSGLFLGQVGRDVYVIGRDVGTPGQYDAGADTIVKLENVSLLDLGVDDFVGLSGPVNRYGNETVIDGTAADETLGALTDMEAMDVQGFYIRGISGGDTVNTSMADDIVFSGEGGDALHIAGGTDLIVYTSASQSYAGANRGDGSFDTLEFDYGEGTVVFDVGAPMQGSYEITQSVPDSGSFVDFLNSAFDSVNMGDGYQAMLLNDGSSGGQYIVIDTGDGVIDNRDYVIGIVGSGGTLGTDPDGNLTFTFTSNAMSG